MYDSKKQPVMAIFTPWEKVLFPRMLRAPGKTRLAGFPAKFNRRKALKWVGSVVPLRQSHGPRLSPKRLAQVSMIESLRDAGVMITAHRSTGCKELNVAPLYGYTVTAVRRSPGVTLLECIFREDEPGDDSLNAVISAGLGMLPDDPA